MNSNEKPKKKSSFLLDCGILEDFHKEITAIINKYQPKIPPSSIYGILQSVIIDIHLSLRSQQQIDFDQMLASGNIIHVMDRYMQVIKEDDQVKQKLHEFVNMLTNLGSKDSNASDKSEIREKGE